MADAKVINYGQQINAGTTAIPDNNATALDIESTDAKDYITVDTTDSGEKVVLSQKTLIADGTASGNIGQVQTNADAFIIDSTDDTGMSICLNGNDPGRISFIGVDNADVVGFRAVASNTTTNSLTMLTNGTDRIKIDSTGKVAVGASSPQHLFHVQDGDLGIVKNQASADSGRLIFTKSRDATDGGHSSGSQADDDAHGEILWQASDGDQFINTGSIMVRSYGASSNNSVPSEMVFRVNNSAADLPALTAAHCYFRTNGNTGFGDSHPNFHFVAGSGKSTTIAYIFNSNTSTMGTTYTSMPNGGSAMTLDHRAEIEGLIIANTTATNSADARKTGIGFFGRVDKTTDEYHYQGAIRAQHEGSAEDQKGYMTFHTNSGTDNRSVSERMRIASDGKIGMNCTNSGYQLEVRGASTHSDIIAWSNSGGALAGRLESYDNEAGAVRVYGPNTSGTANQSQHLLSARDGSNGSVEFNMQKHDCDLTYSSQNTQYMLFGDASADSIGIGHNAPGARVDIKGLSKLNLSDSTSVVSDGATGTNRYVASTDHDLLVGQAITIGGSTYSVATVTDSDNFILDSDHGSTGDQGQATTDGVLLKVQSSDGSTIFAVNGNGAIEAGFAASNNRIIAIGDSGALANATTAKESVFIGHDTADKVTSGNNNTCVGFKAGEEIAAANDCTYIGRESGNGNTNSSNTAVGSNSLSNASGSNNVGIGANCMGSFGGADSVAIGVEALDSSSSIYTTAVGYQSLTGLASGALESNSAFGYRSGDNLDSGQQCLFLGADADTSDDDGNNQIAIGYGSVTDGPNKIRLGNSSIATCNIQVDWTVDSDERIKENIQDADAGLEFINALRPVSFTRKHPAEWPEEIREKRYKEGRASKDEDGNEVTVSTLTFDVDTQQAIKDEFDSTSRVDGLIAQEVKAAIDTLGVSFNGIDESANGKMGIQYSTLVVPLIKAVQTLSAKVKALEEQGN